MVAAAQKDWAANAVDRDRRLAEIYSDYAAKAHQAVASAGTVSDWNLHHLQETERALREAAAQARVRMNTVWAGDVNSVADDLYKSVNSPLGAAIGSPVGKPYQFSDRLTFLSENYVPSLITNIGDETLTKITAMLRRGMMGGAGLSQAKLMSRMTELLGGNRARMRTVFRTEANRLHNLARTEHLDSLAQDYPMVGKRWVHRPSNQPRPAHSALHGVVIYPKKGQRFNVNGFLAAGPHDPNLPAEESINCHCGVYLDIDEKKLAASTDVGFAP
jgi:hypothetical protein